jgi:hypothetical protein
MWHDKADRRPDEQNSTNIWTLLWDDGSPNLRLFSKAGTLVAGDANGDGIDDVVLCNDSAPSWIFVQNNDMPWRGLNLESLGDKGSYWSNVRLADISGDGVADLIVCGPERPWRSDREAPYVRVFEGKPDLLLLFNFDEPLYEIHFEHEPVDLEVLDATGDGILDIYVVMTDRFDTGTYCGNSSTQNRNRNRTPSIDVAHDVLLVGTECHLEFMPVVMEHEFPGCGGPIAKWGERSLMLAKDSVGHNGPSLLLEWPIV